MGTMMISDGLVLGKKDGVEWVERYRCSFCGSEYDDRKQAKDCFRLGFDSHVKVGDIVVGSRKYNWYDGSKTWIYDYSDDTSKKGASHLDKGYRFFYLCVAITQDRWDGKKNSRLHFPVIHYITGAMECGHTNFSTYYKRHEVDFAKLQPLKKVPTDYYTPFTPPKSKIPISILKGAKDIIEKKECSCKAEGAHADIGWKTVPGGKK